MKWTDLSTRDRKALLWGGCLLCAVTAVRVAAVPTLSTAQDARMALQGEQALLDRELSLLREASLYPHQFEELAARLLEWTPALLPEGTPARIHAHLSEQAKHAAAGGPVMISGIESMPPVANEHGFIEHSVRMEGEGDLEGILTMLGTLEAGPLLLRVENLSLASRRSSSDFSVDVAGQPETLGFRFEAVGFELTAKSPARSESAFARGREGEGP